MDDKAQAISVANLSKSYPAKTISLLWSKLSGTETYGEVVLRDEASKCLRVPAWG